MWQTIVMTIRRVLFWILLAVTILGGVYLGLFACGGFLWHRMLIERVCMGSAAASFLLPPVFLKQWYRRILLLPAIYLLFNAVQCFTNCFYPSPPSSLRELIHDFILHWQTGLC